MNDFLRIDSKKNCAVSVEEFIAENLNMDVEDIRMDMDFYNISLNALLENTVKLGSKLRDKRNRISLLAMMVYSYKEDKDLDEWMVEYGKNNNTYLVDQKKNYLHMKQDYEQYCKQYRQ